MSLFDNKYLRHARKLVVTVIGFTALLIGIAMIVLPGPAFIVIPFALGILATEYLWAKRLLKKSKEKIANMNRNNKKQ